MTHDQILALYELLALEKAEFIKLNKQLTDALAMNKHLSNRIEELEADE